MRRYAAFLRAINVSRRYVKMDVLRSILSHADELRNIQTYIASGNLIFETDGAPAEIERVIETHLQDGLGFSVPTFVRSADELRAVAAFNPFGEAIDLPGFSMTVSFLREPPPSEAIEALLKFQTEADRIHVEGREVYWLRLHLDQPLLISNVTVEKTLQGTTMRGMSTVHAILKRYFSDQQG